MKDARNLFRKTGTSLLLFLLGFGLIRDIVIIPLLWKLWNLALLTTPDGFIVTKNLLSTLVRAPWILVIGLALLAFLAFLTFLKLTVCMLGIGYVLEGHTPYIRDLLTVSVRQIRSELKNKNLLFPVYLLVLLPIVDIMPLDSLVASFVLPEFIEDYIALRPVLVACCLVALLGLTWIALRWFFVLPSFVLESGDFGKARAESRKLTKKGWLMNGLRITVFDLIETLRIGLIPFTLILLPVFACWLNTMNLPYATGIYSSLFLYGLDFVKSITKNTVSISVLCFLVLEYRKKREAAGESAEFSLPALSEKRQRKPGSVLVMTVVMSLVLSVLTTGGYLGLLQVSQDNSELIAELFSPTKIIAHKGYSSRAPENTMPAFKLADECECVDMIELDVWSTSDGVPVVIHNRTLDEACGISKNICDCTYEELKNYPAPYAMDPKEFPDAVIPSLEEVIKTYADSTPLLIEIKGYEEDPALPEKIVALMKKYGCTETSRVQSGNYEALKAVKAVDPDISCGLILLGGTGNFAELPCTDFFSIEHSLISVTMVGQIHRSGKEIYAWTVNYEENAEKLKFSGVDGLITDYPEDVDYFVSDTNEMLEDLLKKEVESFFGGVSEGLTSGTITDSDV